MAVKVFNRYLLNPIEAYKLNKVYEQTRKMIGTVTRRQVKNMYLSKKYKFPNPDEAPTRGFSESAPRLSVATVSSFKPFLRTNT